MAYLDPHHRWRGYEGSGNIQEASRGFVHWADLSVHFNLPERADWVMCLEVGEHVPTHLEGVLVRNLHAHNCRGLVLSWGGLGQAGLRHINNHSPRYLHQLLSELGYRLEPHLTSMMQGTPKGLRRSFSYGGQPGGARYRPPRGEYSGYQGTLVYPNLTRPWPWFSHVEVWERILPLMGC